jgi:hypothetical protein
MTTTTTDLLHGLDASDAGVATLFARVRDLPFGFAAHSDPETLLTVGFGTCSPKHALLARLYAALGLETRFVYVAFRFEEMPGAFPAEFLPSLHDGVVRGHTALQLRRPGGWIDVDATFDRPLATAGFVVTEGWDGRTSMPLTVTPVRRVESTLPPAHEAALLGLDHRTALPRPVIDALNLWLDGVRRRAMLSG